MEWANKTWIETQEEKDVMAPKVSAQGQNLVAQAKAKLSEMDYSELLTAATQVMQSVRSNENVLQAATLTQKTVQSNEEILRGKVESFVQDEKNQEMLEKAIEFGTAQLSRASAYASDSLATYAPIF